MQKENKRPHTCNWHIFIWEEKAYPLMRIFHFIIPRWCFGMLGMVHITSRECHTWGIKARGETPIIKVELQRKSMRKIVRVSASGCKTCCVLSHLLDPSKEEMFSKKGEVPITSLDWLLLMVPPLHFLPSHSLSLSLLFSLCVPGHRRTNLPL